MTSSCNDEVPLEISCAMHSSRALLQEAERAELYYKYRDENAELKKHQRALADQIKTLHVQLNRIETDVVGKGPRLNATMPPTSFSSRGNRPQTPGSLRTRRSPSSPVFAQWSPNHTSGTPPAEPVPELPSIVIDNRQTSIPDDRLSYLEKELQRMSAKLDTRQPQVDEELRTRLEESTIELRNLRNQLSTFLSTANTTEGDNAKLRYELSLARNQIEELSKKQIITPQAPPKQPESSRVSSLLEEKASLAEELQVVRRLVASEAAVSADLKKLRETEAAEFQRRLQEVIEERDKLRAEANRKSVTRSKTLKFPEISKTNSLELVIGNAEYVDASVLGADADQAASVLVFSFADFEQETSPVGVGKRPAFAGSIVYPEIIIDDNLLSFLSRETLNVELYLLPAETVAARGTLALSPLLLADELIPSPVMNASLQLTNKTGVVCLINLEVKFKEAIAEQVDAWRLRMQTIPIIPKSEFLVEGKTQTLILSLLSVENLPGDSSRLQPACKFEFLGKNYRSVTGNGSTFTFNETFRMAVRVTAELRERLGRSLKVHIVDEGRVDATIGEAAIPLEPLLKQGEVVEGGFKIHRGTYDLTLAGILRISIRWDS